jgi:hypothetical protein
MCVSCEVRTLSTYKKSTAIPVTDHVGLWGYEVLRIPLSLDNRLTDGGEVVSPTHLPSSTPQKHIFLPLVLISVRG